jgi:hypothetical protein
MQTLEGAGSTSEGCVGRVSVSERAVCLGRYVSLLIASPERQVQYM